MKNKKNFIEIEGKRIGENYKPYIVAELSANHNGNLSSALEHIEIAAQCGADAVKIQTYTPDTMTIDCDKPDFLINGGLWDGYKLHQLYQEAHTPYEWHPALFEKAREVGITLFSTPFDETAVDLLEDLNTPAYKIASFEITDLPLIKYIAKTGKPLIISTGMANYQEIEEAVVTANRYGCNDIIILHCLSSYPAPVDQCNLNTITDLREKLKLNIGLSDHTLTNTAAITAVALGAVFIEKHFIINREQTGPDSTFSITPKELKSLVNETVSAYRALGHAGYKRKECEEGNIQFRRSLYFTQALKAGEKITEKNLRRIRPGMGLQPKHYHELIGKTVNRPVEPGTPASWELIQDV